MDNDNVNADSNDSLAGQNAEPQNNDTQSTEDISLAQGPEDLKTLYGDASCVEQKESAAVKFDIKKELIEWGEAIVLAVIAVFLIRTFLFTMVKVDGESMLPTLKSGDRLMVVRLMYKPARNDIVIFMPPDSKDPYVKRVIGLGGDTVEIINQKVYVNGEMLDEHYINEQMIPTTDMLWTLEEDTVFVLGDNRNRSKDSRIIGPIQHKKILGKATYRVWPFSAFGKIE